MSSNLPSPELIDKSSALASLERWAERFGLSGDDIKRIVLNPDLEKLPTNSKKRFQVYKAVASILGVASSPRSVVLFHPRLPHLINLRAGRKKQ
jgi:hypothetical protein